MMVFLIQGTFGCHSRIFTRRSSPNKHTMCCSKKIFLSMYYDSAIGRIKSLQRWDWIGIQKDFTKRKHIMNFLISN